MGILASLASAASGEYDQHHYVHDYFSALSKAGFRKTALEEAPEPIRPFVDMLQNFSARHVRNAAPKVYAADAYLNDTLKTVRGAQEIREYLIKTLEELDDCEAEVHEVQGAGKSFYVRWELLFRNKALRDGEPIRSIGVSHALLDSNDRVVVHQDFWDAASAVFAHVPVAGLIINKAKSRL